MAAIMEGLQQGYAQLTGAMSEGYEQLVNALIRPPREKYDAHGLGNKRFKFQDVRYIREDVQLASIRAGRPYLQCSHFKPEPVQGHRKPERPCVVYLHANASSRLASLEILPTALKAGADLFCFDFAGCGISGGQYVSLGHFEKEDLEAVLKHLRSDGTVTTIGLWGRSMGAATALMHGDSDPSIAAMVLDSPFSDLRTLALDLCKKETFGAVPQWLGDATLAMLRRSVQQRAGFDIYECTPIAHADRTFIPAMFVVADQDDFILPYHSHKIKEAYGGESILVDVVGDHNSRRPASFHQEVEKFFLRTLHVNIEGRQKDSHLIKAEEISAYSSPILSSRDVAYAPLPEPDDELARSRNSRPLSSDRQEIRSALIRLGFPSQQADAALHRNSTFEGCVDWLVDNGGRET
jgi:pimeloyl-ACP methyl ester carboxylesterase